MKKMKKAKEDYRSLLVRNKEAKVTKEVKFVKAKEPKGVVPTVKKANVEKKKNMAD